MRRRELLLAGTATPLGVALGGPAIGQEIQASELGVQGWGDTSGVLEITDAMRNPNGPAAIELGSLVVEAINPQLAPCGLDPRIAFEEVLDRVDTSVMPSGAQFLGVMDEAATAAFGDQYIGYRTPFGFAFTEPVDCAEPGALLATDTTQTTGTVTSSIEWPPDPDTDPPDE